jgi:hypothetical protein
MLSGFQVAGLLPGWDYTPNYLMPLRCYVRDIEFSFFLAGAGSDRSKRYLM